MELPRGKRPLAGLDAMIDKMSETPRRNGAHHRRALSDTSFRFISSEDDDNMLLLDSADLDLSSLVADLSTAPPQNPTPVPVVPVPMTVDSDDSSSTAMRPTRSHGGHFRSLSMDSEFFDGINLGSASNVGGEKSSAVDVIGSQRTFNLHRQSNSVDGASMSLSSMESDSSALLDGVKKAMPPDRLAELALIDPKRAKRILANRQSAARSKERKVHYTNELERKVQTLQTEATSLSAQVTMLQRDTTGLTAENKELKIRLQAMEQQAQLREALNDALREEVQRLKIATGQIPAANGNSCSRLPHQYSPFASAQSPPAMQQLHASQPPAAGAMPQSNQTGFSSYNRMI